MTDYQRIAQAICFLGDHRAESPDLASLAAESGLSQSRFQQLISDWAGATPCDPWQSLTLSNAKELLAGKPARFTPHAKLETATPAEIKARGARMTICAGVAESPFGRCLIGESSRGICHLSFFDRDDREHAIAEMHADWPLASLVWNDRQAAVIARRIFSTTPDPSAPPWKLHVRGTPFQLRVWQALLSIPPGALVSYGKLAAAAGNPKAARATGSAVGANAISWLIPCHRVIRETGVTGHYRWGAVRKHAMLTWENARNSRT